MLRSKGVATMVWQPEVDELKHRKHLAEQMGGEESIARQHTRGKLTVRERSAKLADPGSFREIGGLAGSETYDGDKLVAFTPANSVIGLCTLNGRKVVICGGDFTVRCGATDADIGDKIVFANKLALNWRLPLIRLLDAAGGSVRTFEQLGRTYLPDMTLQPDFCVASHLLSIAPVVSAVMGSVAGGPAIESCMSHFNLMVRGTSQVFVGSVARKS